MTTGVPVSQLPVLTVFEGTELVPVVIVGNISGITQATSAVVTINNVSATNPFYVGLPVMFQAVTGMTQINTLISTISAIGGASGAWTLTVPINSTAFSAYGSGGEVTVTVAATVNQFSGVYYPRTTAEIAAGVTPVNTKIPELNIQRYWAGGGNSIYTAVANALLVAAQYGGALVRVPAYAYVVDSASLATPWNIPSNTKILGDGLTCTFITVTGTSQTSSMWQSIDTSNVEIQGIYHTGNSQANAFAVGNCFTYQTSAATNPCRNIRIHECGFANFKGDYWLWFYAPAATQVYNALVYDSVFLSMTGNARDGTSTAVPSACVAFQGSSTNATGYFVGSNAYDNVADCTYIKQFCIHWHGNYGGLAHDNWVIACGTSSQINNNTGAYAFLAYDNAGIGTPPNVKWSDNYVGTVKSDGFYSAAGNVIEMVDNYVGGQTDTLNATIPKGAFSVNGVTNFTASGNACDSCMFGLSIVGMPNGAYYKVDDTKITNILAGGTGVIVSGATGQQADTVVITDLEVEATTTGSTGVLINTQSNYGVNKLVFDGFRITANSNGMQIYSPNSSAPELRDVEFRNGSISGFNNAGLIAANLTDTLTRLTIDNVKFFAAANVSTHLNVAGSLKVTLRDLEFCDYNSGSGVCVNAVGTQGRMAGVQFNTVSPAFRFAASSMGLVLPTWTGGSNDFVQNLDIQELGSASSKYQIIGWNWDVTNSKWNAQRALTGN